MRKPSGRLPVDRAPERAARPSIHGGISAESLHVAPITEETRNKAQRAVTFVHLTQPETPETIAASGEVLAALGLLPVRPVAGVAGGVHVPLQPLEVTCPFCEAAPGVRCHNDSGGIRPIHAWRTRLAERGEMPSLTPEKENPTDE